MTSQTFHKKGKHRMKSQPSENGTKNQGEKCFSIELILNALCLTSVCVWTIEECVLTNNQKRPAHT